MNRLIRILPIILALATSGCAGYQLGGVKPTHLANVTKIAVPGFENLTLEPRLGSLLTNAVIKQIQADGTYQVVSRDQAEAVLQGQLANIDRSQFRAVRNNVLRTSQLLVRLNVRYKLVDPADGSELHRGRAVGESYIVLDPNFQMSELQAMEEASQRLAVSLVADISEGW
jgi:hypothetical protein